MLREFARILHPVERVPSSSCCGTQEFVVRTDAVSSLFASAERVNHDLRRLVVQTSSMPLDVLLDQWGIGRSGWISHFVEFTYILPI